MRAAFAVPPIAAMLLLAILAVAESRGVAVVGTPPTNNMAEAAATGERAIVARLIGEGENPTRVIAARPEIVGVTWVTPLEAAVLVADAGMVVFFDRLGAIVGDDRRYLACLAQDREETRITRYLMPDGVSCEPGAAVAVVGSRNR